MIEMRLVRSVVLALIVAVSLLAHGASYADAGGYALTPIDPALAQSDPGDPGFPPD